MSDLVRRTCSSLTRKVADGLVLLINLKNTASFGAILGFTVAAIFAWKFLRPSTQRQRANALSANDRNLTAAGASSSEASPNQNELEEALCACPSGELTFGQIVRKKLNGGTKMTCQLLGVILEEKSPDELQEHATLTVRASVLEVLREISKSCELYLMETVNDDESEEKIIEAMENAGLFKSENLMKDKVLFCSTPNGRSSFVRQLEPDWHVDTDLGIISSLSRFIRYHLHISESSDGMCASNVFRSSSLEQYFSCL